MALLAAVFWALNAALIYFGVRLPIVYLTTFNLASATYAFVDVVCDALMVTWGRQLQRVGLFVNFQWTVLAIANIGAVFLGAWFQEKVQAGEFSLSVIFMATGIPPFFTALVGLRNIEEQPVLSENRTPRTLGPNLLYALYHGAASQVRWLRTIPARMAERFHGSMFNIAGITDERTLILEIFVYISLAFTLLTLPLIPLLQRELARSHISIDLAGRGDSTRV